MAKPIASVASDFANVVNFLQARKIIPEPAPAALLETAKKIHRATYSLILWRFRLKNLPEHSRVFIEEIASDALQILPQTLMGYSKTAKLLIRGIIENTLRHLYFSDHPVEFERMNREQKWYMTVESLFEYPLIHPVFLRTEPEFDAVNRLKTLYGELSAGIHGRRVHDLEMRLALKKIVYHEQSAQKEAGFIERCAESANFLIAMFHRDKMTAFRTEDRQIILRTMCQPARRLWTNVD